VTATLSFTFPFVELLFLLSLCLDQQLRLTGADRLARPGARRRSLDAVAGCGELARIGENEVERRGSLLLVECRFAEGEGVGRSDLGTDVGSKSVP
jgi:hypothetical protein